MRTESPPPLDARPPYLAAALASATILALYIVTLGPSTAMWDTSEYIAAAYTMGLPHPPGNPFFVLLGRVFTLLPIAPNVAMRVNALAAVCSAVTAGIWFLVAHRVLAQWVHARWQRLACAALASLIGGTAFTVWSNSVVNEKVYTVSLVGLALVSWIVLRWIDNPERPGANKLLILAAYLMGLGYANHMAGLLALPATGMAVMLLRPRTVLNWKLMLACAGALLLGITPFATQPIRSSHFPTINEGETTACTTEISASCVFTAKTYERFKYNFDRLQYGKPSVTERQAPISAQVGMWWLYFKWQWLRDPDARNAGLQGALAAVFFALGLLGAWVHYRRDPRSFAYFAPLMVTLTLVLIYYLNFRYGASQADDGFCYSADPSPCEVRDRDYFFLWSFSAWSVWAAVGLAYAWHALAALVDGAQASGTRQRATASVRALLLTAPVLVLAFVPIVSNWSSASRRGDTDTADWARDLLNSVEPYGILVTAGDNDMFPLWYAQEVEGVRRDVVIANTSLMNTDWFVRQMIRRPVFDYDADTGPALYRGKSWQKPTGPVLSLSFDEADSIPLFSQISQPMEFVAGELRATVTPRTLMRADWLVYRLIQDNPNRPVHFAYTTAYYADDLGFSENTATHGLTRKLTRQPLSESDTMKRTQQGWVDVAATSTLWNSFDAPASLMRKGRWIDRPSVNVPRAYLFVGMALRDSMLRSGQVEGAEQVFDRVKGVANAIGYGEAFREVAPPTAPLDDTGSAPPVPSAPPPSGAPSGARR